MKDSNPHIQSQSLLCYPYTNPLFLRAAQLSTAANRYYYTEKRKIVNRFFEKSFFFFLRRAHLLFWRHNWRMEMTASFDKMRTYCCRGDSMPKKCPDVPVQMPSLRLGPSADPTTIGTFAVAGPEEMGVRVLDNFCEEHIQ